MGYPGKIFVHLLKGLEQETHQRWLTIQPEKTDAYISGTGFFENERLCGKSKPNDDKSSKSMCNINYSKYHTFLKGFLKDGRDKSRFDESEISQSYRSLERKFPVENW